MMAWFWDAYEPDVERRMGPFASPLRASDEQLAGPPPAFLIVDEADVLRDEGEAYAARLRAAGTAVTTVRYDGTTHDFMMLNPLSDARRDRAGHRRSTQRPEHDLTSARCRATLSSDAARHSARAIGLPELPLAREPLKTPSPSRSCRPNQRLNQQLPLSGADTTPGEDPPRASPPPGARATLGIRSHTPPAGKPAKTALTRPPMPRPKMARPRFRGERARRPGCCSDLASDHGEAVIRVDVAPPTS